MLWAEALGWVSWSYPGYPRGPHSDPGLSVLSPLLGFSPNRPQPDSAAGSPLDVFTCFHDQAPRSFCSNPNSRSFRTNQSSSIGPGSVLGDVPMATSLGPPVTGILSVPRSSLPSRCHCSRLCGSPAPSVFWGPHEPLLVTALSPRHVPVLQPHLSASSSVTSCSDGSLFLDR